MQATRQREFVSQGSPERVEKPTRARASFMPANREPPRIRKLGRDGAIRMRRSASGATRAPDVVALLRQREGGGGGEPGGGGGGAPGE